MHCKRTDAAAHNAGTICKRETKKTIKYDKKCRMCRTVKPSPKMSQLGLERKNPGNGHFSLP